MSYAVPGQPAAPRSRPTTVRAATWLLLGVAAIFLITALMAIVFAGTFGDIYEEAYAGTDLVDLGRTLGIGATVGGAVVNLLFAAGFVVLAMLDNRGKNPARIITWVVGGLALCCTGVGLLTNSLSGSMGGGDALGGPSPAELQRLLEAELPGWYFPLSLTLTGVSLAALLVAVVLLALPASNEFFRKPAPPAEPPPPYPPAPL